MEDSMALLNTASNYQFSAVKVDELGASEYTLVTIAQDVSRSVSPYAREMEKCLKTILESCQKSPRAENLMLRLVGFNASLTEFHGFKLLSDIDAAEYDDSLMPTGGTALFDAVQSSVEATKDYAVILDDQDFLVNAIVFVVTDGDDNSSSATAASVKNAVDNAMREESLESLTVVLVGVDDQNPMIGRYLQDFQKDANITQFVGIGEATAGKLAKLANFISQSISSTSQALGSGSPSQLLTF